MADSRNFGTMQARIADEIKRANLSDQIAAAIADAIYFYQQDSFFFNEATDSNTSTVAGTNLYPGPADMISVEALSIALSATGIAQPLRRRSLEWVLDIDRGIPPVQGQPTDYAIFANQVRLFTTPDGAYVLTFYYRQQIPVPTADTDAGFWMTTAELMIRSMAKGLLYDQAIRDHERAQVEYRISRLQYEQLKKQSAAKLFTGQTARWRF